MRPRLRGSKSRSQGSRLKAEDLLASSRVSGIQVRDDACDARPIYNVLVADQLETQLVFFIRILRAHLSLDAHALRIAYLRPVRYLPERTTHSGIVFSSAHELRLSMAWSFIKDAFLIQRPAAWQVRSTLIQSRSFCKLRQGATAPSRTKGAS